MTTISLTPPIHAPQTADAPAQPPVATTGSADAAKPRAPAYFSPVVRIDPKTEVAVWEVRDPQTGKVIQQYPREASIKAYRAQSAEVAAASSGKTGENAGTTVTRK